MSGWLKSTAGKLIKYLHRAGRRNSAKASPGKSMGSRDTDSFSIGIHFEALEPRILLSGSGEGALADSAHQAIQPSYQDAIEMESFRFHEESYRTAKDSLNETTVPEETSGETSDSTSPLTPDALRQGVSATDLDLRDPFAVSVGKNTDSQLFADDLPEESVDTLTALEGLQQDPLESNASRELIIVDSGVSEYKKLVDDLLSDQGGSREMDVSVLDSDRDGLEQISDVLAEYQDLDAVHIVSHGTDRAVKLGDTWLYGNDLDAHSEKIAGWKHSLAEGADLLFYGCDLAGGEEGRALLDAFGSLTDADVAASTDDTGHARYFGDWVLEYGSGSIETEIAFSNDVQQNWFGLMAVLTVSTNNDLVDAPNPTTMTVADLIASPGPDTFISLREAIIATNNSAGADEIILPGGPSYTLSITGTAEDAAATGDLDITDDLTITGADAQTTIIDALGNDRVLQILGGIVDISKVTITGGR